MKKLIDFYFENAEVILAILFGLYEIGVRVWPTYKNWSIIDFILKALPNRRKTLPIIIFVLASLGASAQLNGNFKSVRLTVNDTTTTLPINGTIIYNTPTQEFYVYQNFGWEKMVSSGGGAVAGATNGLTLVGDSVQLGGALKEPTTINVGAYELVVSSNEASFSGITYNDVLPNAGNNSLMPKLWTDTHLYDKLINTTLADGEVLLYNSGTDQWEAAVPVINNLVAGQIPVSDGAGSFESQGLVSSGSGTILSIGDATTSTDIRQIAVNGTETNITLSVASKGNGTVALQVGGTTAGIAATSSGATIQYDMNGTAGVDRLLNVGHASKQTAIEFLYSNTSAQIYGGHRGTGPIPTRIFSLKAADSNNAGTDGDSLEITGGDSGTNADGGSITLTPGAGNGTGVQGYIILPNLPTSAVGLPSGALWSNLGILTVAP